MCATQVTQDTLRKARRSRSKQAGRQRTTCTTAVYLKLWGEADDSLGDAILIVSAKVERAGRQQFLVRGFDTHDPPHVLRCRGPIDVVQPSEQLCVLL